MSFIKTYNKQNPPTNQEKKQIVSFLFTHLQDFGDPKPDIEKAVEHALKKDHNPSGLLLTSWNGLTMTGAVVINNTGMKDYIPENILVYVATHYDYRGRGIGRNLMMAAIEQTDGDIALHVEHDNPAIKLYESLGFTNKYQEMRLKK